MSEFLKIMKDVETSIGNDVHCLTDIGTTKHLVNLPGVRFKTVGRGFFMQCMISCGAPCCRTLQVVRFCIAPRKTRQSQRHFFKEKQKQRHRPWLKKSMQVCPLSFILFATQKTFGLPCECYSYMFMVMSQSCRFQKREETFGNDGLHLVPHYQLSDREAKASGWHKADGCKLTPSTFSKEFWRSRVLRGAPDTMLLWLFSVHARALKQDWPYPWTTTSAMLVKPVLWSDLAEQNICKGRNFFLSKDTISFLKMDHSMGLSKAQRHKISQLAQSGGMKPLGKDEIPPCAGTSLTVLLPRDMW